MRSVTRIVLMVVLLLGVGVASDIAMAQSIDDITLRAKGNPPACALPEGEIYLSNASSTYQYRVTVVVRVENDNYGPDQCSSSCTSDECECTISDRYEVEEDDPGTTPLTPACYLPHCLSCLSCDNQDCDDISHCTCVYGYYDVTHYSSNGGQDWTKFTIDGKRNLTVANLDQPAECPTPVDCDY